MIFFRRFSVALIFSFCLFKVYAQHEHNSDFKLGFSYGKGSQNRFPFNSDDYTRTISYYKLLVNYKLKQKRNWSYEFSLEPSYNIAEHQLLNPWFVQENNFENYLELRDLYMQNRTLKEYVLNIGFIVRYSFCNTTSAYLIGSVGPMIGDKATERLAGGFAFSDVFGLGISYNIKKIQLDFRYSVRHTSNAEFKSPNSGHNTTNFEFALLFDVF